MSSAANRFFASTGLAAGLAIITAGNGELYAEDMPGYWVGKDGQPYTTKDGNCWRNSNWDEERDYVGTCEGDQDEDGVPDEIDQCPDTPIGTPVDDKGCPLDSDGDGVINPEDRCPGTDPGVVVDEYGCVLDSDDDGVADNLDACPNTPPNTPVDARGCPTTAEQAIESATTAAKQTESTGFDWSFPRPTFAFDSARLSSEAKRKLDDSLVQIRENPRARFEIAGHTDSVGPAAYNLGLSERRALAAKVYLKARGVADDRLVTKGYGESQPIADNNTAEGRAQNRRVEIKMIE